MKPLYVLLGFVLTASLGAFFLKLVTKKEFHGPRDLFVIFGVFNLLIGILGLAGVAVWVLAQFLRLLI